MVRLQREFVAHLDRYDAIYMRGHPLAWPAARAAYTRDIPVVQECNGMYADLYLAWPHARPWRWALDAMQRSQYAMSQRVVCVTPELSSWVSAQVPSASTVVIPNGVNLEVFCDKAIPYPGLPAQYAVFFGNFAPWQGVEVLIEAFESDLWPRELPLVVVGDGAMRPQIEAASRRNPDRFLYVGPVPYADMGSVVANALMSVIPIDSPERATAGFSPLKLYESMACGTPVVVADTGGLGKIVNEYKCGVSFAVADASDLARHVAELSVSPEHLACAGSSARKAAARECSWKARAAARAEILREIADG